MKKIVYIAIGICSTLFLLNCSGEQDPIDEDKSVISIDEGRNLNDFDKYLQAKVVEPYNVEILYKYVDGETKLNRAVVPASYDKSIEMANLLIYLCFDAYNTVVPGFIKDHFPKKIFLVGSGAYRNNGTFILGEAEGGKKITLFKINDLNTTNVQRLYADYFRTIYHEFSHILHQKVEYSRDFNLISEKYYVGDTWNDAWDQKPVGERSIDKGFISDYASSEPNEDFVELIAHYVTSTPDSWKAILDNAGEGKPLIEQKMVIIKNYLNEVWKLDLDKLRDEIDRRAKAIGSQDLSNITL